MNELTNRLQALLAASGWTVCEGTALAFKDYPTAVGIKRAHAYVADYGRATAQVWLSADYQSEGRNICESRGMLIPKADAAGLDELVARFADAVDAAVAGSYAARLLRGAA